eukprot:scaffold240176_cov39-Tisochrysis_lutea.AAC.1
MDVDGCERSPFKCGGTIARLAILPNMAIATTRVIPITKSGASGSETCGSIATKSANRAFTGCQNHLPQGGGGGGRGGGGGG